MKNAIDKANGIDLKKYQDGSEKEVFVKALDNAKAVYANDKATEEEIAKATLELNTAMDKLKPIDNSNGGNNGNAGNSGSGEQNGNGQTSLGNNNQKPSAPVKTGDTAEPFGYMAGMAAGLAAVVAILRKRK